MRLYPFRGIRYGEGLADRGSLAAPPYDQIDDALAADLREDPHQFTWLTRPIASELGDPYETARQTHEEWFGTGILQKEPRPALYPYEILLPGGGRRLGLTALVGLEDPSSQIIRPHEQTVDKTVEERLALLRTTGLDLEPILLLSDDDGGLDSLLAEDLADGAFLIEHQDSFGNRHRLFRLEDADRIERYRRLLESCPGLIADGHHRYEVAIRHATERGLELGSDNATKLTVITSLNAPGLTIDPIHRGLREVVDLGPAAALAKSRQPCEATSGGALAAAAAAAEQPAFAVLSAAHQAEIWSFAEEEASVDPISSSHPLAVLWLHEAVLPRLGLDATAAANGRIAYRSDPERLFSAIRNGDLEAGFWLPPMSPRAFSRATAQRALLPPKSTRFLPKIVSGLVWASLREDRERYQ